jgi:hypothetical protein
MLIPSLPSLRFQNNNGIRDVLHMLTQPVHSLYCKYVSLSLP